MSPAQNPSQHPLRTWLVLGRVSNLPTVWSNCLAGYHLGDGGELRRFGMLCVGATCLYLAGMFLNDAFDVEFDRQHRQERPLPAGIISIKKVWTWGAALLAAGVLCLASLGKTAALLSLLLAGSIVFYDAVHKRMAHAPILMALCRFLLYLLAASCAASGATGLAVWSGLALACYVIGLSYLARRESLPGPFGYWPALLLTSPIALALIVNASDWQARALSVSVILAAWVLFCLRRTFWAVERNIGQTVSGLLAGIVLVDLLAVSPAFPGLDAAFLLLFIAALVCQRFIPAT